MNTKRALHRSHTDCLGLFDRQVESQIDLGSTTRAQLVAVCTVYVQVRSSTAVEFNRRIIRVCQRRLRVLCCIVGLRIECLCALFGGWMREDADVFKRSYLI